MNKKVLESLIVAGAFDSIHTNRAQLFEVVDDAIKYGQQINKNTSKDQINLFGDEEKLIKEPELPNVEEWDNQDRWCNF